MALFSFDNPVLDKLGWIGDLMMVNVCFLLGCLPVVTIGTSVTAAHYTLFRMRRHEGGAVWRMFWKSYRENLVQSMLIWLLYFVVGVMVYVGLRSTFNAELSMGMFWSILSVISVWLYFSSMSFAFALQARFHNTIFGTIKNALFFSASHPIKGLFIGFLQLFPVLFLLFAPAWFLPVSVFWLVLGFSLILWLCNGMLWKCIAPFSEESICNEE